MTQFDERVHLCRRLPDVREPARLVDGDRNEVLDQVCPDRLY